MFSTNNYNLIFIIIINIIFFFCQRVKIYTEKVKNNRKYINLKWLVILIF